MEKDHKISFLDYRNSVVRQFRSASVPVDGWFEITGRCNLDCKMCYIHTNCNEYFKSKEKPGSWWIEQIRQAYDAGMLFALLTGGECLLHPDFKEIYLYLKKLGVRVNVNTNGILLNDHMLEFFKQTPPDHIQVTLYGSDDDHYESVTGHRVFRIVKKNITALRDSGLPYRITITPSAYCLDDAATMLSMLRREHFACAVNQELFDTYDGGEKDKAVGRLDPEARLALLQKLSHPNYPEVPYETLPPAGGSESAAQFGTKCGSGRTNFMITWDQKMQPCMGLHTIHEEYTTFADTWERIKKRVANYQQPQECIGCKYLKVCLPCPVFRSQGAPEGHCNPQICELTKRKVAAGLKKLPE